MGMELGGVDVAVAESTDNEGGSWIDMAFRIIEPRIVVARRLWAAVLADASFLCLATNRVESDFAGREEGRVGLGLVEVDIVMWGRRAFAVESEFETALWKEELLCLTMLV